MQSPFSEVSFEPSSPSLSLYSWSSSYASSSSRTSSVSTHTRSPPSEADLGCTSSGEPIDLSNCSIGASPQTFCATSFSSRTSPIASTSTLSSYSSQSAPTSSSFPSIPDLALSPAIIPTFSTPQHDRPATFSRAPSTSSTTSEFDDEEECPPNFSEVAPGLYRSSFPKTNHFAYLKTLGLKSVLSFTQEEYPQENLDWLAEEGIKFRQISMPGNKNDGVKVPSQSIRDALAFVLDSENWPLLMHCNKGKHRTGCVVGCLRKLQNWSTEDVFEEYKRFSFPKSRVVDQHCINKFDVLPVWEALVATGRKPNWLEDYRIPPPLVEEA